MGNCLARGLLIACVLSLQHSSAALHAADAPARLPYVSDQAASSEPDVLSAFDKIRQRGGEPQAMHRVAANAPKVFGAFLDLAYALRFATKTERMYRELMILRATQLEGGDYEFVAHRPMAMSCGITGAQIEALAHWKNGTLFDAKQRAVLALADGMAASGGIDDKTYAEIAAQFSSEQIVELIMTGGFYVMTSRLTKTGGVPVDPARRATSAYGRC